MSEHPSPELVEAFGVEAALLLTRFADVQTIQQTASYSELELRRWVTKTRYPRGPELVDRIIDRLGRRGLRLTASKANTQEEV